MPNRTVTLQLDRIYTLEELYAMDRTILTKMCWLFDVSGWVGNIPQLLREAIFHIPHFSSAYHALGEEQQIMIDFLASSGGKPVPVEQVYQHFISRLPVKKIDDLLLALLEKGWLLAGENPASLLVIPEMKKTLDKMEAFYQFLEAQLPATHSAVAGGDDCLTDLIEVAAFLYLEKPKLTAKKSMSKSALRRLMPRVSTLAAFQWEEAANDGRYTNSLRMLLGILQEMGALKFAMDDEGNCFYELQGEKWEDFIFSPAPQRLLYIVSWQISRMHYHKNGIFPFIARLLLYAAQAEGKWLTGASLMMKSMVDKASVLFSAKDPFSSEDWLEVMILEPFLYCGLFEKTTAELPAQWLLKKKMPRNFWRLTPLGMALAEWLKEKGSSVLDKMIAREIHTATKNTVFTSLLQKWHQVLPEELEQQLILQPDLSFIVPKNVSPYVLWMVSVFGESQAQDYVYQGVFSRNSVLQALKGGASGEDLFKMLREHSKMPPAESVLSALSQWVAAYDKTLFSRVMVLACDTSEMAMELLAQAKLSSWIIGAAGPRVLLIKPEGEKPVRKWLEKKNWVPRTGVDSGEGLYTWLQRYKEDYDSSGVLPPTES